MAAISTGAAWVSNEPLIGTPGFAGQQAISRKPAAFFPALLVLGVCALAYLLATALFLNPNLDSAEIEEESTERSTGSRCPERRFLGWFISRITRGAAVLVFIAAGLELISNIAVLISVLTSAPAAAPAGITVSDGAKSLIGLLLSFAVARLAVVSFTSLRANGSLEILLAAPVTFRQLVMASRRAFWRTVLWAFVLAAVGETALWTGGLIHTFQPFRQDWEDFVPTALNILLNLPYYEAIFWLGTYFAMRLRKTPGAVLLTLAVGLVAPVFITTLFRWISIRWFLAFFQGLRTGWGMSFAAFALPLVLHAALLGGLILLARRKLAALEQSRAWEEKPQEVSKEKPAVIAA